MIKKLAHLNALRKQLSDAGMLEKAKIAGTIGEVSYQLAMAMAERIVRLETEVEQCKTTMQQLEQKP